jgi:transposase
MTRRKFSREFKIEAIRLVTDRGVAVAQAARDLDIAESVLRRWIRELSVAPAAAFPGNGQMRADQAEADEPGAQVAEVARRHEISRSILWTWRKQARAGRLTMSDLPAFLPVVVDAVSAMDAPIAAASAP